MNDFDVNEVEKDKSMKGGAAAHSSVKIQSNGSAGGKWNNVKDGRESSTTVNGQREKKGRQAKPAVDTVAEQQKQQDEYCQRFDDAKLRFAI